MKPVVAPTSSIPSSKPSLTGLVASFDVAKTVTTALTDDEILAIEEEIIENFNVNNDEVSTTGMIFLILSKITFI